MKRIAFLMLAFAAACGPLESEGPLEPLVHTFPEMEIGASDEDTSRCQSWTLDNDEPIFVNRITMSAGPAWHHSNWFFVPEDTFPGEDGTWNCNARDFDEFTAGLSGGVFFAQSTQSTGEVQQFPPTSAVLIPARSKIVGDVHLVNADTQPLSTSLTFVVDLLREEDVVDKLRLMTLSYFPLEITPHASSEFRGDCDAFAANGDRALDFRIHYVLPHYHQWGDGMFLRASGEAGDLTVFDEDQSVGEPWGRMFDPPLDLTGMTDLSFGCRYTNDGDDVVYWGNSTGEMCMMLAYTDDNSRWIGGVTDGNAVVGTDGNGTVLNSGPCQMARI